MQILMTTFKSLEGVAEMKKNARAMLYTYPGCLFGHVGPRMRQYSSMSDMCQRQFLYETFANVDGKLSDLSVNKVDCCDVHVCAGNLPENQPALSQGMLVMKMMTQMALLTWRSMFGWLCQISDRNCDNNWKTCSVQTSDPHLILKDSFFHFTVEQILHGDCLMSWLGPLLAHVREYTQ